MTQTMFFIVKKKLKNAKDIIIDIQLFLKDADERLKKIKHHCIDEFQCVAQKLPDLASEASTKAIDCKVEENMVQKLVITTVSEAKKNSQKRLANAGGGLGLALGGTAVTAAGVTTGGVAWIIGAIVLGIIGGIGLSKYKIEPEIDEKTEERKRILREKWAEIWQENHDSWENAGQILLKVRDEIEKSLQALRRVYNGFEEAIEKAERIQNHDCANPSSFRLFDRELTKWTLELEKLGKSAQHFLDVVANRKNGNKMQIKTIAFNF